MIITIIFCVVSLLAIVSGLAAEWGHRRVAGIGYREYKALSWPAQQTIKSWHKVPASNRPAVDIMGVLRALDKKHGGRDEVNSHYSRHDRYAETTTWSWNEPSHYQDVYKDYAPLCSGFDDIVTALGEQEYTFAMAGVASHLDTAKNIRAEITEEANMIREITAKVSEDMK